MALASPQQRLAQFLRSLPFPVEELPSETCLVGGAVRDALLERRSQYIDFDFVVPERAVEIAREISQRYRVGFVVLDAERHIARVVFPEGTLDFAQQEGDTLLKDLYRRDYCANAIAYHIRKNSLIDPLQGLQDLNRRVLRMVSPANLADDPLRLLRAYRQAAQLGFSIDTETRRELKKLAPLIKKIAAERIQHELNYLLEHATGDRWLGCAYEDGVLAPWLPDLDPEKLARLAKIEGIWQQLTADYPALRSQPEYLPQGKLCCLVNPDPAIAQKTILKLKYSRNDLRVVMQVLEHLPPLMAIAAQPWTLREEYLFFLEIKTQFPVLALVARAFGLAAETLEPLLKRYFNPADPVAHPQPLVTGKDLIAHLHLKPSPQIGYLLTELQVASIEGKVSNKSEALELGRSLLDQGES